MPVRSQLTEEELKEAAPASDYTMFERENFDQKQLRYEFANVEDIDLEQIRPIEREDQVVMDPESLELPVGPAGFMEDYSDLGGMGKLVVEGEEWVTWVYNHGFQYNEKTDNVDVADQRTHVMEMLQYFGDLQFFFGVDGLSQSPGMFDWLRDNIPANRTFDCENYDGDSGDTADYSSVPEDLLRGEAIEELRGRVIDINSGWDLAVGSHDAVHQLAGYSIGATDDQERGPTFLERLQDSDVLGEVFRMPYKMQPDYLPRAVRDELPDVMSAPVVDENTAVDPAGQEILGRDELFLIPDVETWREEFLTLREMGAPEHFATDGLRGDSVAHDYKWRTGFWYDPLGEHPEATDCIHLKNVSALFGKNN
jgi:hypothetical protein